MVVLGPVLQGSYDIIYNIWVDDMHWCQRGVCLCFQSTMIFHIFVPWYPCKNHYYNNFSLSTPYRGHMLSRIKSFCFDCEIKIYWITYLAIYHIINKCCKTFRREVRENSRNSMISGKVREKFGILN